MKKVLKNIFNFFASIDLTIFLLSAITLLVILQVAGVKMYTVFKDWPWLKSITSKEFFYSPVFIVPLILFCVNLLACCIKHLKKTADVFRSDPKLTDDTLIDSLPIVERLTTKGFNESIEKLSKALSAHFRRTVIINAGSGQCFFYAEKGKYTNLAFYLAHLSMLTLVAGVIISTQ